MVGGLAGPQGGRGLSQLASAPRLVLGVPAGLGPLLPLGHPQHADAVHLISYVFPALGLILISIPLLYQLGYILVNLS